MKPIGLSWDTNTGLLYQVTFIEPKPNRPEERQFTVADPLNSYAVKMVYNWGQIGSTSFQTGCYDQEKKLYYAAVMNRYENGSLTEWLDVIDVVKGTKSIVSLKLKESMQDYPFDYCFAKGKIWGLVEIKGANYGLSFTDPVTGEVSFPRSVGFESAGLSIAGTYCTIDPVNGIYYKMFANSNQDHILIGIDETGKVVTRVALGYQVGSIGVIN